MPPLTLDSCLSEKYMTVLLLRSKTNHRLFHVMALETTRLNTADLEADDFDFEAEAEEPILWRYPRQLLEFSTRL